MTRVLIVNPFASGVDDRRLAAVQAALPAGTETVLTTARGDATEIAREWSSLRRGDLRLLGRRDLQRGRQRDRRRTFRSASSPGAGRACCPARSVCHAIRNGPPRGLQSARRDASRSAGSTGGGLPSTRASGSMPSSSGASTRSGAGKTENGRATSPSAGRSSGRSGSTGFATSRCSRSKDSGVQRSR